MVVPYYVLFLDKYLHIETFITNSIVTIIVAVIFNLHNILFFNNFIFLSQ